MAEARAQNVVERARKLRRLASSSNAHEAASAEEKAREFMDKHGLTEDDLAEDAVEVVQERCDALRRELARAVGSLRGVGVVVNQQRDVAFRGRQTTVRRAVDVYQALLRMADACWEDARVRGSPDPIRQAWRTCAWLGFVEGVVERCRGRRPKQPSNESSAPADSEPSAETETPQQCVVGESNESELPFVASLAYQLKKISYNVNIDWLYREAVALGRATAAGANIDGLIDADDRVLPAAGAR